MKPNIAAKILKELLFLLILCALSFAFLAFYSYYTSPFTACDNGGDSAFFCLVGRGMTKGYLPYRDFFDMKGPFLFLIEYVGQAISYGRSGIFLVQCINLFITLALICEICRLCGIRSRSLQLVMILPIIYILSFTFEGGNLTEEFSLVPLFSCLYICLKFFDASEKADMFRQKGIFWYSGAWYGFCFGLLLMIRVTNAALICAMIFTVVVYLLKNRQPKQILICALMFIAGFVVSVLPAVLYYASKGLLKDMLEAVFVLGLRYSGAKTLSQHFLEVLSSGREHLLLLVVIPCLSVFLLKWRSWKERLLVFVGSVASFFVIASGNNYTHYYTLAVPLVVLGEIAVLESVGSKVKLRTIIAFMAAGTMLSAQFAMAKSYYDMAYSRHFHEDQFNQAQLIQDVSSKIPEEERDSVFSYNLDPSWYTYADLFPCIRYCGWQNRYLLLMPQIYHDMEKIFQENPPKWLLLPEYRGQLPAFIEEMLDDEYMPFHENEMYILFSYVDGNDGT